MGKKQGKIESKISKKTEKKFEIGNWIKVVKPKVFITDSSSFKNLVQELTGKAKTITAANSGEQPETSFDSLEFGGKLVANYGNQSQSDERSICFDDVNSSKSYGVNIKDHKLVWDDLELLISDIDYPIPNCYSEVSVYDYELSGLLL